MASSLVIIICSLLIIAYIFDISSVKTRVPSIVLLLLLGQVVKQFVIYTKIEIPDVSIALSISGNIGLMLIVLEGAMELDVSKNKLEFIKKSFFIATIPIIALSFLFAFILHNTYTFSFKALLANSIPLSVISSAIAIPTAKNLLKHKRVFITYESSLSDIVGVLFFNFIVLNEVINIKSVFNFSVQLVAIILITFISTLFLIFLLQKLKHHVKFIPILLFIILFYTITKSLHLPALLFILLFGLILSNIEKIKSLKIQKHLKYDILQYEIPKFREITSEIAFLARALFFLLFGYSIELSDIINPDILHWSIIFTCSIFLIRYALLKLFKMELKPELFIAPRGLITILLFLNIPQALFVDIPFKSIIIQVILLCAFFMTLGMLGAKQTKN